MEQLSLLDDYFEQQAIERIQKFSRLAEKMGFEPVLGFSGGKDSQVCYDLCKRAGIKFSAKFNHCFESGITLRFIREYYPDVEWRREVKKGFFSNISDCHKGMLPTNESAYCCEDYKHNRKYVDDAAIIGIRRAESAKRASRTTVGVRNKTTLKRNKDLIGGYFSSHCVMSGAPSEIQLHPIIDWSDADVWKYIRKHNLPINPEYGEFKRVGCVICPKANFNSNYKTLVRYPKLIDCIIKARSDSHNDWYITGDKKDYVEDKVYYVCRWLNHSFRPFTERQLVYFEAVREAYEKMRGGK